MILYKTFIEDRTARATGESLDPGLQLRIGLMVPPHVLLSLLYSLRNLAWLLKPFFFHGKQ